MCIFTRIALWVFLCGFVYVVVIVVLVGCGDACGLSVSFVCPRPFPPTLRYECYYVVLVVCGYGCGWGTVSCCRELSALHLRFSGLSASAVSVRVTYGHLEMHTQCCP